MDKNKEIYQYYFIEKLSQRAIATRLRIDQSTVSRILKKIKAENSVHHYPPLLSIKGKFWRYHALHFVVEPYYFFPRYAQAKKGYAILHHDWMVHLHDKNLEVQLRKGFDFASPNKYEAMRKSQESLMRTLNYLSNEYGFEIWKEKRCTIKLVREHLAQAKSPLAKARKGEYLQIKCKDGFVHFIIDKSNYEEHEYVKANAALSDSDKCEPHIQDWIDNQPPTNSELSSHLSTLSGIVGDFIQESRQSQAATSKAMAGLTDALIGLVASTQMLLKILTPKPAPAHEADGELKAVPSYIG